MAEDEEIKYLESHKIDKSYVNPLPYFVPLN